MPPYKRSRATFEDDLHAPYAIYGTPLPDESESRDDGSYVPVWKQEVRDEKGLKRLHGAFTGGWSAGYFNTVGSKEGWTPSTFVSSRSSRQKDGVASGRPRPEDYMDEEDLADAADAQKLQTSRSFAGLGSSTDEETRAGGLVGLLRPQGDTVGFKLLRMMGWKEGQGIGPKVRRKARLDVGGGRPDSGEKRYAFAPDDVPMIQILRKTDRRGLGQQATVRLPRLHSEGDDEESGDGDEQNDIRNSLLGPVRAKSRPEGGGIGVGILNDGSSDEEDHFAMGPKIKYNKVIGGGKKKKKNSAAANLSLGKAPVFVPKTARRTNKLRRCHDGRLPLVNFTLATSTEDLTSDFLQYAPPEVPPGWKSCKDPSAGSSRPSYVSTADAAKASAHNPASRAAMLGEKALPGKSVFDFLSAAARDQLAAASGRSNLPPAKGEIPKGFALSDEDRRKILWDQAPKLDRETAMAAISRSLVGPYADDEAKRGRYRAYLEHQADPSQPLPAKPAEMRDTDFLRELTEFHNCARIFKPMTGFMASRFTTAKARSSREAAAGSTDTELQSMPSARVADPAEEAAKLGMFGTMTRSVLDFYPTRLLCKRFNVKPPEHSRPDGEPDGSSKTAAEPWNPFVEAAVGRPEALPPESAASGGTGVERAMPRGQLEAQGLVSAPAPQAPAPGSRLERWDEVRPDQNDAVEGGPAPAELLRHIFGDSDSDLCFGFCLGLISPPPSATLSGPREVTNGRFAPEAFATSPGLLWCSPQFIRRIRAEHCRAAAADAIVSSDEEEDDGRSGFAVPGREQSPPPRYPTSEASSSQPPSPRPPPFSSLYVPLGTAGEASGSDKPVPAGQASRLTRCTPAYLEQPLDPSGWTLRDVEAETKRALPVDTKPESSACRKDDDSEPPPAYSEGDSPLLSFAYLMAAAGGASSIITQVQQGGPPVSANAIGDVAVDETIAMDLRGTKFVLSRDELLTLPEFVLLSLFPNGLFPEGQMNGFSDGDAVQVDYDPASLQYMLDFFRNVAQSIPSESLPSASQDGDAVAPTEPPETRDDSKRAGIIVLREDLDFYAIPPRPDITQAEMLEVKRATARALQQQDGIFSGLKRSDEPGTTEAHLIEMLTAGGFNHDDHWGHRAGEPNKAVVCSLALARLRSDIRGNDMGNSAVGMAQKLLLFWRKPARRCWWEGVELENVEGLEGVKLKVWIRRVWTLEMSVIGLR